MCVGPLKRFCHWGPLIALGIIKSVTFATVSCLSQWWPPHESWGSSVLFFTFMSCAVLTLYCFLHAMFTGPGTLPLKWEPEKAEDKQFLQFCGTCESYKAPRTHHCRKCGSCVMKMDHHCPWINNCVGHKNHCSFAFFLLFAVLGCAQASVVLSLSIYHAIHRTWYIYYGTGREPIVYMSLWGMVVCMFVLGLAIGVVLAVGMLLYFQLRAILRNRTAIEDWILEKAVHRRGPLETPFIYPYNLGCWNNFKQVINISCDPIRDGITWSVREECHQYTLTVSQDGQRGSLTVYVLYKTRSSLHIVNPISHQEGNNTLFSVGKETEEAKPEENLLISRVLLMGAALPPRMPESGPVMLSVVLKDAVLWHGSVVVDEYSFIDVQEEGSTKIDLAVLSQVLKPLSNFTQQDSLTLVSGTIINVEEENAFIYFICGNCKSDKVQEVGDGCVDCAGCGQKSTVPNRAYFLEVWLDCGADLQQAYVKVKLYQKTIKKLLLAYCGLQEEKYSATSLLGHHVGPMVCVLLQLQRPRHYSTCTYSLAELPY